MRRLALLTALAAGLLIPAAAVASQSAQPRVVGGQATTIGEYPWQGAVDFASAKRAGNPFQRQFCGGSLVTSRIVLTAAHCVFDTDPDCATHQPVLPCNVGTDPPPGDGTAKLDRDDVTVILGRTTLTDTANGVEHDVIDVHFQGDDANPPVYNPNFGGVSGVPQNDVGYLVLDTTPSVPTELPIKIAGADETTTWAPGVFAEITGWGSTAFGGNHVNGLRAGSVPLVSDATCGSDYGGFFDPASMVCAGYQAGGVDTCQGDSGGPLESALAPAPPDPDSYRLVGITSWGEGCAQAGFPGVYTRVGDPTLRSAIAARVAQLELDNGIAPPENVVGSGRAPLGGGPKYPPPPVVPATAPASVTLPPASDPFAKCRKIRKKTKKQRKKRKRCNRKVRKALKG